MELVILGLAKGFCFGRPSLKFCISLDSLSGNLFELLIEANPTKPSFGFHYLQRACAADGYPYASIFEDLRREYRGNAEFYQKLDEIEKNYREILEEQPAEVFP